MDQNTILIIEDDQEISKMLATYLEAEGYQVISAYDGVTGLDAASRLNPDLVLLDLILPGISGREICRTLRKNTDTSGIPVIMMTSCSDEIDRVVGFEVGADDYVVKPFSVRELSLRIKAVLRRNSGFAGGETPWSATSLRLDPERCAVLVSGKTYFLTQKEYRLLAILAENPEVIHPRESLLRQIWEDANDTNVRVIDAHVKRLRKKLEGAADLIRTVHGQGYKLRVSEE